MCEVDTTYMILLICYLRVCFSSLQAPDHPAYLPTLYACEDVMSDGIRDLVEDIIRDVSNDMAAELVVILRCCLSLYILCLSNKQTIKQTNKRTNTDTDTDTHTHTHTHTHTQTKTRRVERHGEGGGVLFVCWLLNIPATCWYISGMDLHRQFYMLPHWGRSCRSNFLPHPVTGYWHRVDQSQRWPYNARRLAGKPLECQFVSH